TCDLAEAGHGPVSGVCRSEDVPNGRQLPMDRLYCGREMPSFFILDCSVVRFIASLEAAPCGRPCTQSVSRRTAGVGQRCASGREPNVGTRSPFSNSLLLAADSLVLTLDSGATRNSAKSRCSAAPCDRMTARSMTFCISRMLPGQGYCTKASIAFVGMVSIC